jgi:hypothetical protein
MTSDEHRTKCADAIEIALGHMGIFISEVQATAALDSLHGIARVVPVEATKEMIDAASKTKRPWADCFELMAAAGDLTNDPEAGLPTAADVRGILKPEGKP